jgi:hypothetical protein
MKHTDIPNFCIRKSILFWRWNSAEEMGHGMRWSSTACWLVVGLMVAQLWLEVSAGEGMHYLVRISVQI